MISCKMTNKLERLKKYPKTKREFYIKQIDYLNNMYYKMMEESKKETDFLKKRKKKRNIMV